MLFRIAPINHHALTLLVATLAATTAASRAEAFFCFSFSFGGGPRYSYVAPGNVMGPWYGPFVQPPAGPPFAPWGMPPPPPRWSTPPPYPPAWMTPWGPPPFARRW